jgi:hypothetical protein
MLILTVSKCDRPKIQTIDDANVFMKGVVNQTIHSLEDRHAFENYLKNFE